MVQCRDRHIPFDNLSIFADEELGEVPLDITGQNATFFALQEIVEGVSCTDHTLLKL